MRNESRMPQKIFQSWTMEMIRTTAVFMTYRDFLTVEDCFSNATGLLSVCSAVTSKNKHLTAACSIQLFFVISNNSRRTARQRFPNFHAVITNTDSLWIFANQERDVEHFAMQQYGWCRMQHWQPIIVMRYILS